jgi:hypothetical protein
MICVNSILNPISGKILLHSNSSNYYVRKIWNILVFNIFKAVNDYCVTTRCLYYVFTIYVYILQLSFCPCIDFYVLYVLMSRLGQSQ